MLQEQIRLPLGVAIQDTRGNSYRVEGHLGKGGFGTVYLVSDRRIKERRFALKEIINPSKYDRERLLFECEILKRLEHPGLPRVYRVFENERLKRMYMLMEFINGKDLEELRSEQPGKRFPLKLALAILAPVVDALLYLYTQDPPIVHRDIKPANIIVSLEGGKAVLVDFGAAKEYFQDGTTAMVRQGSPGYAAIEQYSANNRTNQRTDVYGLGATLYTLLTGLVPADAVARITAEKGDDPLKPVSELVPGIPRSVSNALQCALAIQSQYRFSSVAAFWQALHSDTFEVPTPEITPYSPATPFPPTTLDEMPGTVTPFLRPGNDRPSRTKKRRALLLALLVIFTLSISSTSIVLAITHHTARSAGPPPVRLTPSPAPASPVTQPAEYPPIGPEYGGTIFDNGNASQHTPLYLTAVRQNQGNITGRFSGLALVGIFTGTVSKDGTLYFAVDTSAGTIICKGHIKTGGDLEGTFDIVDQHGVSTGEYGVWNVSPLSTP